MRVTLLGHASVLVELAGATVLMDPVLGDPFEDGAVTSCPRRLVHPQQLPPVDILVVSHRHPDHFDIPSLARVPRDCVAVCPADPLVVHALEQLGFAEVHPVHPMGEISTPDFELYPTRSEVESVREFGMVFADGTGTFWNQVDSFLSPATVDAVRERFGHVDLLFAKYASQNFEFFDEQQATFPYEEHRDNLETALRIDAGTVVPGAAGFRFAEPHDWLNPFLFPVSRERYAADLDRVGHDDHVVFADPGDVLEVGEGRAEHRPAASGAAETLADDTWRIRFEPTAPIPPLTDPNPAGTDPAELRDRVRSTVDELLRPYVTTWPGDEVTEHYGALRASYRLGVVYPDGREDTWLVDFRGRPTVSSPAEGAVEADATHRIAASALVEWLDRDRTFFSVRALSRRSAAGYQLAGDPPTVDLSPQPLPDLLLHVALTVAPDADVAAKRYVDRQLASVAAAEPD